MKENGASLKGRKLVAAFIVDEQDNAVASREIEGGEKGSVTAFAFDKGQGSSEHTSPFDGTVLVLDGEAEATTVGEPLRLPIGEMMVMPAGMPHYLHAIERFKMSLIIPHSYLRFHHTGAASIYGSSQILKGFRLKKSDRERR